MQGEIEFGDFMSMFFMVDEHIRKLFKYSENKLKKYRGNKDKIIQKYVKEYEAKMKLLDKDMCVEFQEISRYIHTKRKQFFIQVKVLSN